MKEEQAPTIRQNHRPVQKVIFSIFILLFAFFLYLSLRELYLVRETRHWHSVPAKITQSIIQSHSSRSATRARMREVPLYTLDLTLQYEYGGVSHEYIIGGDTLTARSSSELENFIRSLGTTPTLYVNPENPNQASLKRRGLFLASFFALLSILFALSLLSLRKS